MSKKTTVISDDMALANELSQKATHLRDVSREEWKQANEHLKAMGSALNEMYATQVEIAVIIKRLSK